MALKESIEAVVQAQREDQSDADFNMGRLMRSAWPQIEADPAIAPVVQQLLHLGPRNYRKLGQSILRNVFLIELVKRPKIETTKVRTRWFLEPQVNGVRFDVNDPRWCSFEECLLIARDLLHQLPDWFNASADHAELLRLMFANNIVPYEAPLDYPLRRTASERIHERSNLVWTFTPVMLRTLKLRDYLTSPLESPDAEFFRTLLTEKIRIKTYLTDRVLTGEHKTNREKRWEVHPRSVHFAERRECLAIEYALVTQVCSFLDFPAEAIEELRAKDVLPAELVLAHCPITGEPLSYPDLRAALLNPVHGRSDFQVGHFNPLKLGEAGEQIGHVAANIGWISANGNRIQGSLSLKEVRKLVKRMAVNYEKHKWWPPEE